MLAKLVENPYCNICLMKKWLTFSFLFSIFSTHLTFLFSPSNHKGSLSTCLYICLLIISETIHWVDFKLGWCIALDPRVCSVKFGAILTHDTFIINKLWINKRSESCLALQGFRALWLYVMGSAGDQSCTAKAKYFHMACLDTQHL